MQTSSTYCKLAKTQVELSTQVFRLSGIGNDGTIRQAEVQCNRENSCPYAMQYECLVVALHRRLG